MSEQVEEFNNEEGVFVDPIVTLTIEAFEHFITHESNADLVTASQYGINELVDGSWVAKTITEADMVNYKFATGVDFTDDAIIAINTEYAMRPFVELK